MHAVQPDAETVMAVHQATGLSVMKAKELIQTSPELAQRMIDGHKVRVSMRLAKLPVELSEEPWKAGYLQPGGEMLSDPIENDPQVGAIVRETLERVSRELEAARGGFERGLGRLIWKTAQNELLEKHGIVWFTPVQMNPGCCFD